MIADYRLRMPLLGNAPGPEPPSYHWDRMLGGLWWFAFCWTYDYCRPLHMAWWRRILR